MDPTSIYVGMLGVVVLVCLASFAVVAVPTRVCPQCDRRVAVSARVCKACRYRFER